MTLVFVRHAESVSNAGLKDELGDGDQLSPHGLRQAGRLVAKLREHQFGHIYVSPSRRTIQTIAPYLRAVGRRAVVLTMATEMKDLTHILDPRKPAATREIEPPADYEDVVVFDPELPNVVVRHEHHLDGVARAHRLARFLLRQHPGDQSVLLVSHGTLGRYLMAHLCQDLSTHLHHPQNARFWLLEGHGNRLKVTVRNGNQVPLFTRC